MNMATVVITTKNRKDELRYAIDSVLMQSSPVDILVIDDGSTDGTADFVRQVYPQVRVERSESSLGLVVQRNRAAKLVQTPLLFSLDDDAIFASRDVVAKTIEEFNHPRVGAVNIPLFNFKSGANGPCEQGTLLPDENNRIYVIDIFFGGAHAIRRDLFLFLGGYKEEIFHQGEENDYCIRMLNAGYVVRVGAAEAVHHFPSPIRDDSRAIIYGARNSIMYAFDNVPMPYFIVYLAGTIINFIKIGYRKKCLNWVLSGIGIGFRVMPSRLINRHAVTKNAYLLSRLLRKKHSLPLDAIESQLQKLTVIVNK